MNHSGRSDHINKYDLTGKTALITGGARGIGLHIAQKLEHAGASIILTDTDLSKLSEVQERFTNTPQIYQLDVTDAAAVADLAQRLGVVDILVNNAGISKAVASIECTDEQWRSVLAVNLDGLFYCCRSFGSSMLNNGKGVIVNISSMCSEIVTRQASAVTAYNASKAGVNMVTKSLACEWARSGIRVNSVAPGFVASDMTAAYPKETLESWSNQTPMGRLAEPDEIADAVHYLVSAASSYITGAILTVDGGYTCW